MLIIIIIPNGLPQSLLQNNRLWKTIKREMLLSSQNPVNHELTLIPYQTAVSWCNVAYRHWPATIAEQQAVENNKKGKC